MKIAAGTCRISDGVYGGFEEISACCAYGMNYNACMQAGPVKEDTLD
jgi:hypothetical protein